MIEEAISGIASTVPVTSRSAYSFLSAGARPSPAAQITAPTPSRTSSISSLESSARQPGIDSSLSRVPPVWPRPRPDSCGTAAPHAATSGASGSVILSPTPPVECLSAVGRDSEEKSMRSPEAIIAAVQRAISRAVHAVEQDGHRERGHLLVGDLAAGVRVDDPVDLLVAELTAVPLGADDGDGVHGHELASLRERCARRTDGPSGRPRRSGRRGRTWRHLLRWSGPKACGSISDSGRMPAGVSRSSSGPPNSYSSWRQRPHGHQDLALPSTQVKCVSRPPPVRWSCGDQSALGAQAEAVRRVLDVAADDRAAVVDQGGGADRVAGVRGVRPGHGVPGRRPQSLPSRRPGGAEVTCPAPSGTACRPPSASAAAARTARGRAA